MSQINVEVMQNLEMNKCGGWNKHRGWASLRKFKSEGGNKSNKNVGR